MRDSYVVLKDSRMFISSRTVVSSVDNSPVSSSRSAVTGCKTERGKRHVYLRRMKCRFKILVCVSISSGICTHMLLPDRRTAMVRSHALTGQDSVSIANKEVFF